MRAATRGAQKSIGSQGTLLFPVLPKGFVKLLALPGLGTAKAREGEQRPTPPGPAPTPPYPLADEQTVGVLDGGALMQQQRLELAFLNVIEGVEHDGQKL